MTRPKVVHVITTIQRGGAEKQLLILAQEQVRLGWDVEVYYLKNEAELSTEFAEAGVIVNSAVANLTPIKQLLALKRNLRNQNAIIHAHLPQSELFTAIVCRRSSFLVTRHNAEEFYPSSNPNLSKLLAKFVARRAARIITISDAVTNFNINQNQLFKMDIRKLERVYYGFPHKAEPREEKKKLTRYVVGTISRLTPQKDIPTLLISFADIAKKYPTAQLRIAGIGYLEEELKTLAVTLGINHRIKWLGKISDIEGFLSGLDVFVLTSKYEGFGLVLLEAMAANLPIIAAHNSAIPEVLGKHGGLYFKTGDTKLLTQRMDLVFQDTSLSSLNLKPIEQLRGFSAQKMAVLTTEIYSQVLESAL